MKFIAEEKITPVEKEKLNILKKIVDRKISAEANVVSILYKKPELFNNTDITRDSFSSNIWRVFFVIASAVYKTEDKAKLDDITIGFYLEKHEKLKEKYIEYGGYKTIDTAKKYVDVSNFDGYVKELKKWDAVYNLCNRLNIFIDDKKLSEFSDMTIDEIADEYNCLMNDTFINAEGDIVTYGISTGIDDLIDELDQGMAVGLPYHNMPILTNETGGQYMGSITLVGGLSNVGKSAFLRNTVIPSIIEHDERIVIMLNEDGLKKWQREFLVYVANNILDIDMQKQTVRDGNYTEEFKDSLRKAAQWIKEKDKDKTIIILPFKRYKTANVIKVINKYSAMGVKYFALDTYKMDADSTNEQSWLQMQQNMVEINDVVKPESKNLHILITFQLSKGSSMQRYYTQDNIGMAKNIVDPASTCLMIRTMFDDEKPGGKRALKVLRREGINKRSEVPVKLDPKKHYQIIFIVKNREGSANQYQIVIEHDLSRNILKEIGYTTVPVDF